MRKTYLLFFSHLKSYLWFECTDSSFSVLRTSFYLLKGPVGGEKKENNFLAKYIFQQEAYFYEQTGKIQVISENLFQFFMRIHILSYRILDYISLQSYKTLLGLNSLMMQSSIKILHFFKIIHTGPSNSLVISLIKKKKSCKLICLCAIFIPI